MSSSLARLRRASMFGALVLASPAAAATAVAASADPSAAAASDPSGRAGCAPSILVLSAYPAEIGPVLEAAKLDPGQPEMVQGRAFFAGQVEGRNVIIALTGMGMVNAHNTTALAFSYFRCDGRPLIRDVVWSGTAGAGAGDGIGDVAVPTRWTPDYGKTWEPVDAALLRIARRVSTAVTPKLATTAPIGDPTCQCDVTDQTGTTSIDRVPHVLVGGEGQSSDTYAGHAFPCAPNGGNIFGCLPCETGLAGASSVGAFAQGIVPLASLAVVEANFASTPPQAGYRANDSETASAMAVAVANKTPFIAFRGISDDNGSDWYAQFFVDQQLAAENSGMAEVAFIGALPKP